LKNPPPQAAFLLILKRRLTMTNEQPLTRQAVELRQRQVTTRLHALGLTSLDGAVLIGGPAILVTSEDDSVAQVAFLDPRRAADLRIIAQLSTE
jgi:hypothetical protein